MDSLIYLDIESSNPFSTPKKLSLAKKNGSRVHQNWVLFFRGLLEAFSPLPAGNHGASAWSPVLGISTVCLVKFQGPRSSVVFWMLFNWYSGTWNLGLIAQKHAQIPLSSLETIGTTLCLSVASEFTSVSYIIDLQKSNVLGTNVVGRANRDPEHSRRQEWTYFRMFFAGVGPPFWVLLGTLKINSYKVFSAFETGPIH